MVNCTPPTKEVRGLPLALQGAVKGGIMYHDTCMIYTKHHHHICCSKAPPVAFVAGTVLLRAKSIPRLASLLAAHQSQRPSIKKKKEKGLRQSHSPVPTLASRPKAPAALTPHALTSALQRRDPNRRKPPTPTTPAKIDLQTKIAKNNIHYYIIRKRPMGLGS